MVADTPALQLAETAWNPRAVDQGLRAQWDALAEESRASFFQSASWVLPWCAAFAEDDTGTLLTVRNDGSLRGLAVVLRLRRVLHKRLPIPLPYATLAGSGPGSADGISPLAGDPRAAEMLVGRLVGGGRRGSLLIESAKRELTDALRSAAPSRAVTLANLRAPGLTLQPDVPPATSWSTSLRKDTERMERRLAEIGVSGHWIDGRAAESGGDPEAYVAAVRRLAELHRKRWQTEGLGGLLSDTRVRFLSSLAGHSTAAFFPAVFELRHGGMTVAALLAFRAPNTWAYYQSGWEPEWARFGAGRVAVAAAIRRAHADGATYFDFLRGPEAYKYRFGAVDRVHTSIVIPKGLAGRLLLGRERLAIGRKGQRDSS